MKKALVLLVSFAVAFSVLATTPANKTTALTASTSQTANSYDEGEVTYQYFNFTTTAIVTNGSLLAIAKVPAQSRIVSSEIQLSASATTSTNTLGLIAVDGSGFYSLDGSTDADDADGLLTAFATTGAVTDTFASDAAGDLLAGKVVEKAVYIVVDGVAGAAAYPTNETIKGFVGYIK